MIMTILRVYCVHETNTVFLRAHRLSFSSKSIQISPECISKYCKIKWNKSTTVTPIRFFGGCAHGNCRSDHITTVVIVIGTRLVANHGRVQYHQLVVGLAYLSPGRVH
jgi:hypothetical protein